jgi:hypothetical protein
MAKVTRQARSPRPAKAGQGKTRPTTKSQVLVRLSADEQAYLAEVVPEGRSRAEYLRRLLARDKARRDRLRRGNVRCRGAGRDGRGAGGASGPGGRLRQSFVT